jgi:hypothetical protein
MVVAQEVVATVLVGDPLDGAGEVVGVADVNPSLSAATASARTSCGSTARA